MTYEELSKIYAEGCLKSHAHGLQAVYDAGYSASSAIAARFIEPPVKPKKATKKSAVKK